MANVLKFLNDQGIIHGNFRIGSIFTVASGEWKLFGLEYTSVFQEEDSVFNFYRNQIRNSHLYLPKGTIEILKKESRDNTPSGIDGFGFGAFIYQIYNGNYTRIEDLVSRGNIPIVSYDK